MISIVICLALEMFATHLHRYRSYRWADTYALFIKNIFKGRAAWDSPWGVLSVLFLPLLLVALVHTGLSGVWLGLFELVFSVVVLIYCLRYQPLDAHVDDIVDALEQGDNIEAARLTKTILGKEPDTEQDVVQQVCSALLVNVNERMFAVILWFALLGPMGALLYRLSWYYSESSSHASGGFKSAMHRLFSLLNWLPARLLVIGYAVVGSFEDAIHGWREAYAQQLQDMEELNQAIIAHAGCSALHLDRYIQPTNAAGAIELEIAAIHAAHSMVLRTMLAWGIVIAILTVAGWAS